MFMKATTFNFYFSKEEARFLQKNFYSFLKFLKIMASFQPKYQAQFQGAVPL